MTRNTLDEIDLFQKTYRNGSLYLNPLNGKAIETLRIIKKFILNLYINKIRSGANMNINKRMEDNYKKFRRAIEDKNDILIINTLSLNDEIELLDSYVNYEDPKLEKLPDDIKRNLSIVLGVMRNIK